MQTQVCCLLAYNLQLRRCFADEIRKIIEPKRKQAAQTLLDEEAEDQFFNFDDESLQQTSVRLFQLYSSKMFAFRLLMSRTMLILKTQRRLRQKHRQSTKMRFSLQYFLVKISL